MKLRTVLVIAVCLIAALAVINNLGARKPINPARLEKLMTESLTTQEQLYAEALVKRDLEVIDFHTAEDFAGTAPEDGTPATKTSLINSLRSGDLKVASFDLSDLKVQATPTTATVTGTYFEKATVKGADRTVTGKFSNSWAELDGRWQRVKSTITK